MFTHGVRAPYVATVRCAPLLMKAPGSLVVTASFTVPESEQHSFGAAYGMAKAADDASSSGGPGSERSLRPSRSAVSSPSHRLWQ